MSAAMLHESIWFDSTKYQQAESHYQRSLAGTLTKSRPHGSKGSSFSPVQEIAKARKKIQETLSTATSASVIPVGDDKRIAQLEEENRHLKKVTGELRSDLEKLTLRVERLEKGGTAQPVSEKSAPPKKEVKEEDDDDDDLDLFGSDEEEEDEEETAERKARLAAYHEKKKKKPSVIAKSNIILDIKPWDDETDLNAMEASVRSIQCDGLLWGSAKFVPVAFGIKKLQIACVVEDDKIGTDFLEEKITEFEDFVQSVDVVAFNKV
ncbi:elongation factor 1-delta-like isoform X1 [Montipora foliosa]|uniref:elongation factor 1-delta-like isoform X1 n=1 Tax=Montipora foliosa TaxID=591990 RepID=UPI0035F1147D